ncbi:MAG: hypothetical protein ACRCXC_02480 [Legionella sp.]
MQTPAENVFLLLKQKKYEEITGLIVNDENLVNAINPQTGRSLLQMLLVANVTEQSSALLNFVLTHPKLNFNYENTECELTNLDDMIASVRLDVFQTVIQNPKILFNRDKLTYESAKDNLIIVERSHQSNVQQNPNSEISKRSKARVERQGEIIALLREATILHAIKTDDAGLMDRLEQAKAKPTDFLTVLRDKKLPVDLLTASNTNLRAWFKARFDKAATSIAQNPHSFHNAAKEVVRLQAQLEALKLQHLQARNVLRQQAIEADIGVTAGQETSTLSF